MSLLEYHRAHFKTSSASSRRAQLEEFRRGGVVGSGQKRAFHSNGWKRSGMIALAEDYR